MSKLILRLRRAWQALTGPDFTQRVVGLPADQVRRLGAMTLQAERSEAVEHHIMEQRHAYTHATKDELILTLLDRDRQLLNEGRDLANGKMGARILREFVRASLYAADAKDAPKLVAATEAAVLAMGAEPGDLRQLRLHGSTLGPLGPREEPLA